MFLPILYRFEASKRRRRLERTLIFYRSCFSLTIYGAVSFRLFFVLSWIILGGGSPFARSGQFMPLFMLIMAVFNFKHRKLMNKSKDGPKLLFWTIFGHFWTVGHCQFIHKFKEFNRHFTTTGEFLWYSAHKKSGRMAKWLSVEPTRGFFRPPPKKNTSYPHPVFPSRVTPHPPTPTPHLVRVRVNVRVRVKVGVGSGGWG